MALGLRPLLGVFVILWLSLHRCHALDSSVLSWARGFRSRNEALEPNQSMECETLNILLSPETNKSSRADVSYHVLVFEPEGKATMSLVGCEPSSLHWSIQYPAGTQIFVALLGSFGTSLGVLPAMYTVTPASTDCLTRPAPPIPEATQLSSSVFGRVIPCGSWEMSSSGGKVPYSVSIVALTSESVYRYSLPPGEHIPSYTSSRGLSGQLVVFFSDANGMLGITSSIISTAGAQDTPLDSSDVLSKCRLPQFRDLPLWLHEPPRPTTFRFRRTLPDQPPMQLRRAVTGNTVGMNYTGKVAVAVCTSLAGTGIVATAIYIMMYRRRRKILDAQDTLPRPFEVIVPAAATMSTSMITHHLTSPPTLVIPQRIYSQNGGRYRYEARRKEASTMVKPSRLGGGSAPTPMATTRSQPQPSASRITRMQSDASLLSNHAGPSSYRAPPRSSTRPHTLTPPDPRPQSGPLTQPRQSSSPPTGAETRRAAGESPSRSASMREQRSAKHALWLSRSASELYSTMSSPRHHRVPGYSSHGPHVPSGRYDHGGSSVNTSLRPTNHLRHWHSASPVVHVQHAHLDSEEDLGATIIFQHQDAGAMQELPPPYHKLVGSSTVDV